MLREVRRLRALLFSSIAPFKNPFSFIPRTSPGASTNACAFVLLRFSCFLRGVQPVAVHVNGGRQRSRARLKRLVANAAFDFADTGLFVAAEMCGCVRVGVSRREVEPQQRGCNSNRDSAAHIFTSHDDSWAQNGHLRNRGRKGRHHGVDSLRGNTRINLLEGCRKNLAFFCHDLQRRWRRMGNDAW